jgi:hypothetical protein
MINPNIVETIAGTTIKLTWISSGTTASPIISTLIDKSETLVSSVTATSSGNGHYYALHLIPNSQAWYVNEWWAFVNPNTYASRQLLSATRLRVNSL